MKQQERDEAGGRTSSLDISDSAMRELAESSAALVADYFAHISEFTVFPQTTAAALVERLRSALPVEGESIERLMEDCRAIFELSRHNGHPRFWGYVASPSTPVGAFADLIASALNTNVTSWRSAPAATEVERTVVRWLGSLIGFSDNAAGLLTSGGSMANLNALIIAQRNKSAHNVSREGLWNAGPPMTLYASDQIHLSVPKAADIIGLGRDQVRLVPSDENFRLDVRALRELIESDLQSGLKPFCVVASAGTVNTGAVDPLDEVADVARAYNLWFHVDGAYGAPAAVDASKRELFHGLSRADSVSLDAHKWLYTPVDCGCLLLRDGATARAAFNSHEADYIKVHEETEEESFAFWDYGVELSRRFRALKLWMMLRYYGARRLSEAISEDIALAKYFGERIKASEDFELLAPVELSICCFRFVPPELRSRLKEVEEEERAPLNARLNELNAAIMHTVQRGGRAYLSNASLGSLYALRACITNFRTTRRDLDETLDILREAAREMSNDEK